MTLDQLGKHAFDGACKPGSAISGHHSFSVGVFQLVTNASGTGVKRGPVKARIAGQTQDKEKVYAVAQIVAKKLDAGVYAGPKSIAVYSAIAKQYLLHTAV